MKKLALVLVAVIDVYALEDWNSAVAEILPSFSDKTELSYVDKISLPGAKAGEDLIYDIDKDIYILNDHCNDIVDETGKNFKEGVFSVTSLSEELSKATDYDGIDRWHWMLKYSMQYTITCGNHITYKGIFAWRVQLWSCKIGCDSDQDTKTYSLDVGTYDYSTNTFEPHRSRAKTDGKNVVPISNLIAAWNGREVALPKYEGGTGRLTVPVILVSGFNADYRNTWGVEIPNKDKGSDEFQKGLVSGYVNGGLPDILARYQGLDVSEQGINSNGIYFFNAPVDAEGEQPSPKWVDKDAVNSISYSFYERLKETLTQHFGDEWEKNDLLKIDIVGHSQGGLVVREMLRGLREECRDCPVGSANAANHIRKLVTVNTPHLGTPVADSRSVLQTMPDYTAVLELLEDLENQHNLEEETYESRKDKGMSEEEIYEPVVNRDKTLVTADVDVNWGRLASEGAKGAWDNDWYKNALIVALGGVEAASALTAVGTIVGLNTDVSMKLKGNYLGDYETDTRKKNLTTSHDYKTLKFKNFSLKAIRDEAWNMHSKGQHLGTQASFITGLYSYPTLPNGNKLVMQPMYSYDMSGLKQYLLGQIQENATEFCSGDEDQKNYCVDALQILSQYVKSTEDVELENVEGIYEITKFLNSLMRQWLSKSDLLVPVESQTFGYAVDEKGNLESGPWDAIPEFHKPRKYNIYKAQTPNVLPVNMVAHGEFIGQMNYGEIDFLDASIKSTHIPGASRMGLDLLCALDTYLCQDNMNDDDFLKIPQIVSRGIVVGPNGTTMTVAIQELSVSGDFNIKPLYLSTNFQGVGLINGNVPVLVAAFDPNYGTYVWYEDENGHEHFETLSNNRVRWQVGVRKVNGVVEVFANTYEGRIKTLVVPVKTQNNTIVQVYGDGSSSMVAPVFAGSGIATNPETQESSEVATKCKDNLGDVAVVHYEAGLAEKNTSRPRIIVANVGDKPINGFKVAYYFTGDPARVPVVNLDYPNYPVNMEHLGGDKWRFVIDLSNEVLLPKLAHPNKDGYQIRLHYYRYDEDWNHRYDYSADYNVGSPKINDKIVVYDLEGNILWGVPPSIPNDAVTIEKKSVDLIFADAGEYENNVFKPEFTIVNTGSTALKNYKIRCYISAPKGYFFETPTDDWYTPESTPSLTNIAENIWMLEIAFNEHILYPGQSVFSGNIGIHLKNWNKFDKSLLGLVVVDENGEILWGSPWNGSGVVLNQEYANVQR
ncbi:MAG: hypothetical protein HUK21_06560 [Fibrobacteraceae bacterium]|nr:hypothetical protein [Fibrobacteraceae bacterium]